MSGANLRKFILFDANGRELALTPQSNVPAELVDSNGLNLDLTDQSNVPVALRDATGAELELIGGEIVPVREVPEDRGTVILPFTKETGTTKLTISPAINTYDIEVTSAAFAIPGAHVRIIDEVANRFYFGEVLSAVGNVVTLDTPIDYAYKTNSDVVFARKEIAVNGSVSPQTFVAKLGPSKPSVIYVTRIIFTCITATQVALPLFGDLPKLTRGLVVRKTGASQNNIMNVKSNEELVNIAFDFEVFEATNPAQGVHGFSIRLTFGGENKMDATIKLAQGDNLEVVVQDDLTGLDSLHVTLEGNITQV